MWKMTLKQRRRHSELMNSAEALKRDKHYRPPQGYKPGEDAVEDAKYVKVFEAFQAIITELQELEQEVS
ncbi:MAG: hypothetical protein ACJATP_002492 [Candidatus Azotimanducaceae bacterium]|jgi:hypothetical protein